MAALETWKTAMTRTTFSVFLETTVLLKKTFQLNPKKSSFPLPFFCPQIPKTVENLMAETISMKNILRIFAAPILS